MEVEQSLSTGGERGIVLQDEEVKKEEDEEPTADTEEEDEDALPHSEILDIFEEGLARLVQDPLLCDLPIQVGSNLLIFLFVVVVCLRFNFCNLSRSDIFFSERGWLLM